MAMTVRQVRADRLTETGWEPFGWLPRPDTDPRDGAGRLAFEWGDPHLNLIQHSLDEVGRVDGGLRCERLFRHDTHTQALMPLDSDAVVAVAPAGVTFSDAVDADRIRAFWLAPQAAIVLHRGTWHWGPFPIGHDVVTLLNVQGLRYPEDNRHVDLSALGTPVDVLVGPAGIGHPQAM
jgi:hypothetical protein